MNAKFIDFTFYLKHIIKQTQLIFIWQIIQNLLFVHKFNDRLGNLSAFS